MSEGPTDPRKVVDRLPNTLSMWDRSPFAFVLNLDRMCERTFLRLWISQSEVRILPPQPPVPRPALTQNRARADPSCSEPMLPDGSRRLRGRAVPTLAM